MRTNEELAEGLLAVVISAKYVCGWTKDGRHLKFSTAAHEERLRAENRRSRAKNQPSQPFGSSWSDWND